MRIIRESNENEMLLEFFKGEVKSERFSEKLENKMEELNLSKELILNADLTNEEENNKRKLLMREYREYPDGDIFKGFPKEIKWYLVEFEDGDFEKIHYVNWFSWNDISNNTSKPSVAVENLRNGVKYYDITTDKFFEGVEFLKNGGKFNPITAITCNGEKILLIEGHYRVTVYALSPEFFAGTFGYVGFCSKEEMEKYNPKMV